MRGIQKSLNWVLYVDAETQYAKINNAIMSMFGVIGTNDVTYILKIQFSW